MTLTAELRSRGVGVVDLNVLTMSGTSSSMVFSSRDQPV